MKEKINRFAKGIIEYELPRIIVSQERIEARVEMGRRVPGRVVVSNNADKEIGRAHV